jgi:hypothetical protein
MTLSRDEITPEQIPCFRKIIPCCFPAGSKKFPASFSREFAPQAFEMTAQLTSAFVQKPVFREKFPVKRPLSGNYSRRPVRI